jgi:hypothetical protein
MWKERIRIQHSAELYSFTPMGISSAGKGNEKSACHVPAAMISRSLSVISEISP